MTLEINDALNNDMLELLQKVEHKLDVAIAKNYSAETRENHADTV